MALATLNDVFTDQIEDLYSAETQLVGALPKIAAAASDEKLREAITTHLEETREHVDRLQQIKSDLGITGSQRCKGMAGLLAEGEEVLGEVRWRSVEGRCDHRRRSACRALRDRRVRHSSNTGRRAGYDDAKKLLDETLDEESAADKLLTKIATDGLLRSGLNAEANPN